MSLRKMEDYKSNRATRQDVKLAALRCSDQVYSSQWRENTESLFQPKGQRSQMVVVLPSLLFSPNLEAEDARLEAAGSQEDNAGEEKPPDPAETYYSEKLGKLEIVDHHHHDPGVFAGELEKRSRASVSLETVDDVRRLPMASVFPPLHPAPFPP
jgi:hypothetical protein